MRKQESSPGTEDVTPNSMEEAEQPRSTPWVLCGLMLAAGALLLGWRGMRANDALEAAGLLLAGLLLMVGALYAVVIRGLAVPPRKRAHRADSIDDLLGPPTH